jgi:hypothetical protein
MPHSREVIAEIVSLSGYESQVLSSREPAAFARLAGPDGQKEEWRRPFVCSFLAAPGRVYLATIYAN